VKIGDLVKIKNKSFTRYFHLDDLISNNRHHMGIIVGLEELKRGIDEEKVIYYVLLLDGAKFCFYASELESLSKNIKSPT